MFLNSTTVLVELNTPKGSVFSAQAASVELHTTDGVIAINPREESYLNLTQTTRITLCVGTDFLSFVLENAVAGLKGDRFTVLAESIRRVEPHTVP